MSKKLSTLLATIILGAGLSTSATAQMFCQAAFTYTTGSAGSVNFTSTSTGTTSSTVYSWNFGDNATSNLQNPSHTYTYNGRYIMALSIDSANGGCSSAITDSIIITNGLTCAVSAAFTYTTGAAGTVDFTDVSTGVDPGMVYNWSWYPTSAGSSGSVSQQSPSINFNYNGTYVVTMSVRDPNPIGFCYSTTTQTVVVTNGQACQVSFTYTVSSAGQVDFTNTSAGNSIFYWNFGDGASSSQTSPSHTYAYNGFYHVSLEADTNGGACAGYVTDSINITNTANAPTCNASFTYTVQPGGQVDFTNTSTGTVASPTYAWAFGNGQSSTQMSPSYTYTYNGIYSISLQVKDTFGNVICQDYQSIVVNTAALGNCADSAYFYMVKDTTQTGVWMAYLTSNSAANPVTSATWYWGDGTSTNGLSPTHTYATPGMYNICVYTMIACGDSSYYCQSDSLYKSSSMISVTVVNTTNGIKQNTNPVASLKAYPNPFGDALTIEVNAVNASTVVYNVLDIYGNVVMNDKTRINKGENRLSVNTSGISGGVYFVKVTDVTTQHTQTLKVVK